MIDKQAELKTVANLSPAFLDSLCLKRRRAEVNKKFAPLGIVFAALGLLLFTYTVRKAGVSQIVDGIQRLGIAFLLDHRNFLDTAGGPLTRMGQVFRSAA